MRTSSAVGPVICLLFAVPVAVARDIEPRASVAAIYSNNALRSSVTELEETALNASVGVRVKHASPHLNVDMDASYLHREYLQDSDLDSEDLPSGYVNLIGIISPDRLTWTAEDTVGQISGEAFSALSSADRENVNYFTTGPDLYLPLGARNRLQLQGRYGKTNYEESNIDSDRHGGELSLGHELGSGAAFGVAQSYQKIEYKLDNQFPGIELNGTFARYSVESFRTYLVAEAGVESVQVGTAERTSSPHALLVLQRQISPRVTLNLEYRRGFSDAVESFRASTQDNFNNGAGADQDVQAVAEPFKSDEAYAMFVRTTARTLLAWQVIWNREDYAAGSLFDRTVLGTDAAVDYRLSSRLTLAGRASYVREDFTTLEMQRNRSEISIGLNHQLSSSLQVAVTALRARGSGDQLEDRYNESRATLAISYTPAASRNRIFDPTAQFRFYSRPGREGSTQQDTAPAKP